MFVTGTGTGVGKTVATGFLTALLQKSGISAVPYKPIQSGAVWQNNRLVAEDVQFYQAVAELSYEQQELCTYCLEAAASPHLAAQQAGTTIDPAIIEEQLHRLSRENRLVLVEGAGGLAVPLAEHSDGTYTTKDLLLQLRLPIVIVAEPSLGTINHTVLTVSYAHAHNIPIVGILVNRMPEQPTDLEKDNLRMIGKLTDVPILGVIPAFAEPLVHNVKQAVRLRGETMVMLELFFKRLEKMGG